MNREPGIDLLRILSMYFVVLLHVLGQGGILDTAIVGSANYNLAWILEISAYCAVDLFALISGYVMYSSVISVRKFLRFWFPVFFYSLGILMVYSILTHSVINLTDFVNSSFPILKSQYWYVTAYFCLYLFTPFLNKFVSHLPDSMNKKMLVLLFIVFSILPTILTNDIFFTKNGYSPLWLGVLYLFGASIKKLNLKEKISSGKAIILYLSSVAFVYVSFILMKTFTVNNPVETRYVFMFISYTSPFVFLSSMGLFLFFAKINLRNKLLIKLVQVISSLAFGVYLIHVHPIIFIQLLKNVFITFVDYPTLSFVASIFLVSTLIFTTCVCIEYLRVQLFRLLHVNQVLDKISDCLSKLLSLINKELFPDSKPENHEPI